MEERVILHFGGDVQVSGRRAHGAGIAFAWHAQPRAVAGAGRDADLDRIRSGHAALASAGGAGIAQAAGAATARAGEVEAHGAGHLADIAAAFALGADGFAAAGRAGAMAGAAYFIASDIEWDLGALDGLPEIDGHDIFEVRAFFGLGLGLAAAAAKELGENVAKSAAGFGSPATAGGRERPGRHRKNRTR